LHSVGPKTSYVAAFSPSALKLDTCSLRLNLKITTGAVCEYLPGIAMKSYRRDGLTICPLKDGSQQYLKKAIRFAMGVLICSAIAAVLLYVMQGL
jgi:hypothetical protein